MPPAGAGVPARAAAKQQAGPTYSAWIDCVGDDLERVRAEMAGARAADTLAMRRRPRVVFVEAPEVQPIPVIVVEDDPPAADATMVEGDSDSDPSPRPRGKSFGRGAAHGESCGEGVAHGESCGAGSGASGSADAPPRWTEAEWAAWHQEHRWRWADGCWVWRPVGTGPDGGHDCPLAADPARTARNKARKEQKLRKLEERRALDREDPVAAASAAWQRVYKRQVDLQVHELRTEGWPQTPGAGAPR